MKRVTAAIVALLGMAIVLSATPSGADSAQKAFRYYVGCGTSQNAKPSHLCPKPRVKGAFFRSNKADVYYTVCVKFPTKRRLCAPKQEAVTGTLYVNKITSNIPGQHKVTWFVKGKRVGLFTFRVKE